MRDSRRAEITIAAGSVISEPKSGPAVRMASHQASGVLRPALASRPMARSATCRTGREAAMVRITTTNIGSANCTR